MPWIQSSVVFEMNVTKYGATDVKETSSANSEDESNEYVITGGPSKMARDLDDPESKENALSAPVKKRRWFSSSQNFWYGLGHIYNDLCAAMWFSYMMLYFQAVLYMEARVSGAMLLLGQVVDALATPVVGVLADKYSTKKRWHLSGSLMVTCTFPLLFMRCWGCSELADYDNSYLSWWRPLYYAILVFFFQIAWAVVQISHLAMIPAITNDLVVRSELTSIRYMASVGSSLTVYLLTWLILKIDYTSFISGADDYKFRDVALILSILGIISYILFHKFFKMRPSNEPKANGYTKNEALIPENGDLAAEPIKPSPMKILHFLKMPLLYQTSLLYVFSRLYWALSMVYVPLFLEERLSETQTEGSDLVASVPLVMYISSLIFSLLLKKTIEDLGTKLAYIVGTLISLAACLWIAIFIHRAAHVIQIYFVAALFGAGSSITMVASLCITAELIGPHFQLSAIIYSIVTFADKLVTGVAVVVIENLKCSNVSDCPEYYRHVLTYACGGSAILGLISLSFTKLFPKPKVPTVT